MNITIIIPTRNRYKELKKLIMYYKYNYFTGYIFIIDSSSQNIFEKTKKLIQNFDNKKIRHIRFIARPFECTKEIINKVKTKYVCWSGDDDYFVVSGLKKSLKILNNNNQIDAVNSLSIVAKIRKDKILNLRKRFSIYDNFYSTNPQPIKRLIQLMNQYRVPIFSIFRYRKFVQIMKLIPSKRNRKKCPNRIVHDEYLESFLMVYFNKIHHFEFPFLIRTVTDKKYATTSIDGLLNADQLKNDQKKSFFYLENTILNLIKDKKEKNLFSKELKEFIKQLNKKKGNYLINLLSMKFRKFYARYSKRDFNIFFNTINWLQKN